MKYLLTFILLTLAADSIMASPLSDSAYSIYLFTSGENAYNKRDYETAREKLTEFISVPAPRNDTTWWDNPGYIYMRMKNSACQYLKNIYYKQKDFSTALYFHELSLRTYYLRIPRCGNGAFEEWQGNSLFESKCYEGLEDYYNAMMAISQYAVYGMSKRFSELAIKFMSLDSLRRELAASVENIRIRTDSTARYSNETILPFLGFQIPIGFINYKFRVIGQDSVWADSSGEMNVKLAPRERIEFTKDEVDDALLNQRVSFRQSDLYKLIIGQ